MNKKEISEKIRASMMEHLESKGFPDISREAILQQLPNMWRKLEEEKLIQPGMVYGKFVAQAERAYAVANDVDEIYKMAEEITGFDFKSRRKTRG